MWMTLALAGALTLAPGQPGPLALTNVRNTYGMLGPTRPDTSFLPGDTIVVSFDIEGLKTDASGKVLYSMAMEVTDSAGKSVFKQAPRDLEATNALGGNSIPALQTLQVGLDQPPGTYTVKVTVTDRAAGASQTRTGTYRVLPKAFGLVRLSTTSDPGGQFPVPVPGEGQSLWINFAAVGFERDKATRQPNLGVVMTVLDESGRPTSGKPFLGEVKQDVPSQAPILPMQFLLELNRAGKFTVELKAADKVSGKTATVSFPLTVVKPK